MAIGSTIVAAGSPRTGMQAVVPMSASSGWLTIIDAGGMVVQDAATITNPTTQITSSTRHLFRRMGLGTTLLLRMGYDDGISGAITSPIVKVFGRSDANQAWDLLTTKSISLTSTITVTQATDVQDGTYGYTTVSAVTQAWDCLGCSEFLVGVETIFSATGTVNTAFLQGKFI